MPEPVHVIEDPRWLTPIWQSLCNQTISYAPPANAALPELVSIQQTGMSLQDAVQQNNVERAREMAGILAEYAQFEELAASSDAAASAIPLPRIAASYHLWPYYAAVYYGYASFDMSDEERFVARQRLCDVQKTLYANIRLTLDFLRISFGTNHYEDLSDFLVGCERAGNNKWRSPALCQFSPDLCAIDSFAHEMVNIVLARPHMRRALHCLHQAALGKPLDKVELSSHVSEAFRTLGVAQLTFFYNPNPERISSDVELPLIEFVYEASQDGDGFPDQILPFFKEDGFQEGNLAGDDDRMQFRRLAHEIYTATGGAKKQFVTQRKATIKELHDTRFICEGQTTHSFLTCDPPVDREHLPIWYKRDLEALKGDKHLNDWTDANFWWDLQLDNELIVSKLFPRDHGAVHANDHASAYWDYLVSCNESISEIDDWDGFVRRVARPRDQTVKQQFGYLLELLLRRTERLVRTSFFFGLAQTHEHEGRSESNSNEHGRISQFVGGTFLGLERPGIPFEENRFRVIADYMRPLIFALAQYCTSRHIQRQQRDRAIRTLLFRRRCRMIIDLLSDNDDRRSGMLLYASSLPGDPEDNDHPAIQMEPSRNQLMELFGKVPWEWETLGRITHPKENCDNTFKALFEVTDAEIRTLDAFLDREVEIDLPNPAKSYKRVKCSRCLQFIVTWLLEDRGSLQQVDVECEKCIDLTLPSRPGVRFLMSLCEFVSQVQSDRAYGSRVTKLVFSHDDRIARARIVFAGSGLIEMIRKWSRGVLVSGKTKGSHSQAAFLSMMKCEAPVSFYGGDDSDSAVPASDRCRKWLGFLVEPSFGGSLELRLPTDDSLELLWINERAKGE